MWSCKAELVDSGIDWFTSTSTDDKTTTLLMLKGEALCSVEERRGFFVKPWRMAGYHGWRCGRLEYGWRDDGGIIRLSSALADDAWWDIYQITGRCSRIDLQATLRSGRKPNDELRQMATAVKRHFAGRDDGPTITVWSDSAGGYTVYLGKRASSLYFRAYNKEAQSKQPEYAGCLRVELEVKNRLCQPAIDTLLRSQTTRTGLLEQIAGYMNARGILTLLSTDNPRSFYERPELPTDEAKSLEWLREAVQPTVQRLRGRGLLAEVLIVLGLSESVTLRDEDL